VSEIAFKSLFCIAHDRRELMITVNIKK